MTKEQIFSLYTKNFLTNAGFSVRVIKRTKMVQQTPERKIKYVKTRRFFTPVKLSNGKFVIDHARDV